MKHMKIVRVVNKELLLCVRCCFDGSDSKSVNSNYLFLHDFKNPITISYQFGAISHVVENFRKQLSYVDTNTNN